MSRNLAITQVKVNWATFTLSAQGDISLQAHGSLLTSDELDIPIHITELSRLSESTYTELRQALRLMCFELVAAELELGSGQGLVRDGTTFRLAAEGETPLWVKP